MFSFDEMRHVIIIAPNSFEEFMQEDKPNLLVWDELSYDPPAILDWDELSYNPPIIWNLDEPEVDWSWVPHLDYRHYFNRFFKKNSSFELIDALSSCLVSNY